MSKKFDTKITFEGNLHQRAGAIEYKMPKALANEYLKTRKGDDRNLPPQKYLVQIVNEEFGLKENCVRVIVE